MKEKDFEVLSLKRKIEELESDREKQEKSISSIKRERLEDLDQSGEWVILLDFYTS